jgi:hypothetical protein
MPQALAEDERVAAEDDGDVVVPSAEGATERTHVSGGIRVLPRSRSAMETPPVPHRS